MRTEAFPVADIEFCQRTSSPPPRLSLESGAVLFAMVVIVVGFFHLTLSYPLILCSMFITVIFVIVGYCRCHQLVPLTSGDYGRIVRLPKVDFVKYSTGTRQEPRQIVPLILAEYCLPVFLILEEYRRILPPPQLDFIRHHTGCHKSSVE